jgi:hypothetical protein
MRPEDPVTRSFFIGSGELGAWSLEFGKEG